MSKPARPADIVIRGAEADDWEDAVAIFEDPSVVRGTLQLPYPSREKIRDRFENPRFDRHTLVAVVDDQVVGIMGLEQETGRQAHVASLGMMVRSDYQGRGVGTALMQAAVDLAENWLNCSRIELEVYPDNAAALALYTQFGFEIEGTLRDYAFRDGEFVDAYLMARLRAES